MMEMAHRSTFKDATDASPDGAMNRLGRLTVIGSVVSDAGTREKYSALEQVRQRCEVLLPCLMASSRDAGRGWGAASKGRTRAWCRVDPDPPPVHLDDLLGDAGLRIGPVMR